MIRKLIESPVIFLVTCMKLFVLFVMILLAFITFAATVIKRRIMRLWYWIMDTRKMRYLNRAMNGARFIH